MSPNASSAHERDPSIRASATPRGRGSPTSSLTTGTWRHTSCCSASTLPPGTWSCRAFSRRRTTGRTWFHLRTSCRRVSPCAPTSWRRSVPMSPGAWTLRSSAGSISSTSRLASRRSTSRRPRSTRTRWLPSRSCSPRTGWCATWWRTRWGCSGCAPIRTLLFGSVSSTWWPRPRGRRVRVWRSPTRRTSVSSTRPAGPGTCSPTPSMSCGTCTSRPDTRPGGSPA